VPYELGFAKNAGKDLATFKLKGEVPLPAYLTIGKIIRGTEALNGYLNLIRNNVNKIAGGGLIERPIPSTNLQHTLDDFLDWNA